MLTKKQVIIKRIFDVLVSLLLLPFVMIPIVLFVLIASVSTGSNGWFVQNRIGLRGKPFKFYKIRTLKGVNHKDAISIKASETVFGSWLRRTKMDELPQLFNVLGGSMSWVGPRPDVPGYADELKGADRVILTVKPGITGPATLKYKNEDAVLVKQTDPLRYNDEVIWPDKVKMNIDYVEHWSLWMDVKYMWRSVFGS